MIDTHAHIYLPEFDIDRNEILMRAKVAGVQRIYMPNIDHDSIESMLALSNSHPAQCFPMIGLHPCSVKEDFIDQLEEVSLLLEDPAYRFYGIGECGLDYYWDTSYMHQQKEALTVQIELAKKYHLPIILHTREANDDCIEIITQNKDKHLSGIFHCFSGTTEQLDRVIELGFYAGIGGVITFKNGGLDKILKPAHLPHLVLETDAPYLAPVPFRGKRNEPAYLSCVIAKLSEVLGLSETEIEAATTANAMALFGQ